MTASITMLRSAALAGLVTFILPVHAEAQSRDAGARDAGRGTQAQTADEDEEDDGDDDGDDVMYVGEGRDRAGDDSSSTVGEVKVAGGGIGCALGASGSASGALLGAALGVGMLVARRRRSR